MRSLTTAVLSVITIFALTSCSSEDDAAAPERAETTATPSASASASASSAPTTPSPTATPEPAGPTLAVSVQGDDVTPNAEELTVAAGDPLLITIKADRPGELHVHSKPEQYVKFTEGVTTYELVVKVPGEVEIEEHDTGAVVAQVQVTG